MVDWQAGQLAGWLGGWLAAGSDIRHLQALPQNEIGQYVARYMTASLQISYIYADKNLMHNNTLWKQNSINYLFNIFVASRNQKFKKSNIRA